MRFRCSRQFSRGFCPSKDLAIYLAAAERYEIGVVHEALVGYRMSRNSMSPEGIAVCTAASRIIQTYAPRYPGFRGIMTLHLRDVIMWHVATAVRRGRLIAATRLLTDFAIFGTIFTSFLSELLLGLRHSKIKDSWITLLSRGRGEEFDAMPG
jgi:hypothetical protein